MTELIFKLSEIEAFKIATDNIDFKEVDYCYDEIQAFFVSKNEKQLCIGEQTTGLFFESLIRVLKKAVDGKLQLHESLMQNLGVLWNEYCQDKPELFMIESSDGSSTYWVGIDYKIWSTYVNTNPSISTWLYIDNDDNIIFELTKDYKWSFFPDDLQDPEFITYNEFMKDYKPLIHRIIPRDVAVQWLEQAMKIHRGFFSTEENYQNLCKLLKW